ncbi:MAG: SRPBCC family protein [Ginsengibacter sp.]
MPSIFLETKINSSIEICFDLSLSIDLHEISTAQSKEKAIGGKTSGLINYGETVTWQAIHFGIKQKLTSKITQFQRPFYFRDEQLKGAFKYFIHDHHFEQHLESVVMKDRFEFQSPYGIAGRLFNKIILTNYMTKLLTERNLVIKNYAETEKWKQVLEAEDFSSKNPK